MTQDTTHAHRVDSNPTATTYTSTERVQGVSATAIQRTDAQHTRRTAETSPPEAEQFSSTAELRDALAILCPVAGASQWEGETYSSVDKLADEGRR